MGVTTPLGHITWLYRRWSWWEPDATVSEPKDPAHKRAPHEEALTIGSPKTEQHKLAGLANYDKVLVVDEGDNGGGVLGNKTQPMATTAFQNFYTRLEA